MNMVLMFTQIKSKEGIIRFGEVAMAEMIK